MRESCCDEPGKTKKDRKISPLALIIGALTILTLVGGFILAANSGPAKLSETGAQAYTDHTSFEWGEIKIDGGNATHEFTIENKGTGELELANLVTSCACTSAQVTINETASPYFGMHSNSSWVGKVAPGETATLSVIFDPLFHGPEAVGPMERFIAVETNDPQNARMEFKLSGNVIK
uniref:DUF1573 domain-containing protein n=1 Tax=candidate division WWE3 bacterium TaxID=2053526 RepID=A0A831YSY1_UNCKA